MGGGSAWRAPQLNRRAFFAGFEDQEVWALKGCLTGCMLGISRRTRFAGRNESVLVGWWGGRFSPRGKAKVPIKVHVAYNR